MIRYNMVLTADGNSTVVITDENLNTITVTESHPNFARILDALRNGQDPSEWYDGTGKKEIIGLSDRVEIIDGVLHFDGDATYDGLSETIMRYHREGRDCANLVKFMERLSENPSYRSREQLFTWCEAKELTIDTEGYIIAYKGVTGDMLSCHSGKAEVDGEMVEGQIPNAVGTVISMPRSKVNDDPNHGCSHGLHVGNWSYANSFGEVLLEVRVDPADVVSVPADCGFQKMRTCRYEVVAVHERDDSYLDGYEPDAMWDDDAWLDAWDDEDGLFEAAPKTFVERLIDKLRQRA